jgi:hypothetical protein
MNFVPISATPISGLLISAIFTATRKSYHKRFCQGTASAVPKSRDLGGFNP